MKNIVKKSNIILILNILMLSSIFSCRNEPEPEKPKITSIKFNEEGKYLSIGDRATIGVTVGPDEAKHGQKLEYSLSSQGVIIVDEENSSNEGAVIEAVGGGSTVLIAKALGVMDYIDIIVEGTRKAGIPYITVSNSVLEIPAGMNKSVVATLQEGNFSDNQSFVFYNSDDKVVNIETANNVAVLSGLYSGSSRITVSHPKAQYSVDILAFVLQEGEEPKYITADQNVVFMEAGGEDVVFPIRLVNVEDIYIGNTVYQVIEGKDAIQVSGSGAYCNIQAKSAGIAQVRVTNQNVEYPFDFQVVVTKRDEDETYLDVSDNFIIIEGNEIKQVRADVKGAVKSDYVEKFRFNLSEEGIIEVLQTNGDFNLRGIKNGSVVLTVENEYCEYSREILVITQAQGENIINHENYITTNQNVISMELGGSDVLLRMKLVGGIEADRNNFEWVVEDSSVIEASSSSGIVRYVRSVIDYVDQSSFEAEAVITARKVGSTVITIYNPKAKNECAVLVKVYPKGTFNDSAIVLGGPGLIKIKKGEKADIYTPIMQGDGKKLGIALWDIEDKTIASVEGSGVYGTIEGKNSGVTRIKVSGENIVKPYEAVVVVYNEYEEDSIKFIYSDNLFYRMYAGQTINIGIFHPNIPDNEFYMEIFNSNKNILFTKDNGNMILATGLEEGNVEILISVREANSLRITVVVERENVNIDRPYMLTGENFAGTHVGGTVNYEIFMAGANLAEMSRMIWSIEDDTVAELESVNGNEVRIKGKKTGQTILKASHLKSINEKKIVLYVVQTQAQLQQKVVLGIENTHYVIQENESVYIGLITNATEGQKLNIRWEINDMEVGNLESNYDTAVITGIMPGYCKISVYMSDGSHVMPLDIYITVKSAYSNTSIELPSSIVIVKGFSKIIEPVIRGITLYENSLIWDIENEDIITIINNRTEITVNALKKGQTYINVSYENINFYKKILVICVESEEEINNIYYFTVENNYYKIKKGDEIKVYLQFGENGFPEKEKEKIEWRGIYNPGVVSINGSGGKANIVGNEVGVAKLRIQSPIAVMPVEITVEVRESGLGTDFYTFMYPAINKMLTNSVINIPISIYEGNVEKNEGYSLIETSVENKNVADAEMAGSVLRVTGKSQGKTIVTLKSSEIKEDARIMIVVYDVMPPEEEFIVFLPKTHYLVSVYKVKNMKKDVKKIA